MWVNGYMNSVTATTDGVLLATEGLSDPPDQSIDIPNTLRNHHERYYIYHQTETTPTTA
jgi:hypothetical protein